MKLAMVGPYPVDINKLSGGVEASTVYLIEGLKEIKDLDISMITCRRDIVKNKTIRRDRITVHYLPSSRHFGNITLGYADKYKIRQKIKELDPDVIHFQNQTNYYINSRPYCRAILTVHGIIHREVLFNKGLVNWIRRFPQVYLEKNCLKNNDYIISVSPYAENLVRSLSKAKTYFIPYPISDRYFEIQGTEIANRILCAAPISRLKNILDLLKAVKLLKEEIPTVRLHIAGEIRDRAYFKIIREYIKKHGLGDNVKYLGHLSEQELLKEYKNCSILVLFSLQENSPMVIQQAMAAGKPVVAARVGGTPFLIEDGKTGFLVNAKDVKGLAEKIKKLFSNKDLRKKFGENARQKALETFGLKIIAQKTYKAYSEISRKEGFSL